MTYCPACGAEIGDHLEYCPSCGAQVNVEGKGQIAKPDHDQIQMAKPGHDQFQQPLQQLPQLVQRNYLIWFLLSYLTGIFGLVYIYFVFDDLNKLDKYPKPAGVKSTNLDQNSLILYIVLYVMGFALIANYLIYSKKYGMFNDYLDTHPQKQTKLPSRNYIKLMVFRDILLFVMTGFEIVGFVLYSLAIGAEYGEYFSIANFGPLSTSMSLVILPFIFIGIGGLFFVGIMVIAIYMIVLEFRWQEAMNERVSIIDPNFIKKDFI
ncbi:MAG: zinc ribbon domain-containing protein [Candidatus Heimdallarchaeota archaeon]